MVNATTVSAGSGRPPAARTRRLGRAGEKLARGAAVFLLGAASACGAPPKQAAPPGAAARPQPHAGARPHADAQPHGHGHGHDHEHDHGDGAGDGHGPLVHRFEHAEQWASTFDDPARDAWQRPRDVIDAMAITPGMTIADIGAGTGYFEPWLSRATGEKGSVLALDVEPDMVRYLGERAQREHLENVRPGLVAIDDPKLPPSKLDRVLIVDTWHHIPDRVAYATKVRDGLAAGGKVFIVDFKLEAKHGPPPRHRLTAEQIMHDLTAAGLSASVSPTTLPEQYIVVGARR
jgi:SAM-dependent methyltransferase